MFLKKIYQKNELYFALLWIGVYCVGESVANSLSQAVGTDSSVTFALNLLLSVILIIWIGKMGLAKHFGLCAPTVPPARLLWYLPLGLIISHNLWYGVGIHLPVMDTVCYIGSMLCVGFLEEIIFRGFLFKALAKENEKMAIIVSSVTFGLGHLLNLVNGSGMELVSNLCQVAGAIAVGFLFVILLVRGGSLWPCIITHSLNNAISAFVPLEVSVQKQILFALINTLIALGYALIVLTQKKTK